MKRRKFYKNLLTIRWVFAFGVFALIEIPLLVYLFAQKILGESWIESINILILISVSITLFCFLLLFFWFYAISDVVELGDDAILVRRFFSKKIIQEIPYKEVTECLLSSGSRKKQMRQVGIHLFKQGRKIFYSEFDVRLAIELYKIFGEDKIRTNPFNHREKIGKAYQVDFSELREKEQAKLLKYIINHPLERKTADQILKRKGKKSKFKKS